ncbi:PAC2 family protein [Herbiconiux sp. CPCC 205763]|uniref:PAC2 family protein n=1 Tax=Herbiconiux aconitum TaxID=2970913 RepID=A0ABT2GVU4_9MICO|nr:PAC2 family protein [Herbiconiux aconitum]MCS5719400.1 PAC2 family protein [Herbiconiux aconitum]
MTDNGFLRGRLLLVAFEGWNDAGEAATGALRVLKEQLEVVPISEVDTEEYFDFQFNRPTVSADDEGRRVLTWPGATVYGPDGAVDTEATATPGSSVDADDDSHVYLLIGSEPSRNWKKFTAEIMSAAVAEDISGVLLLGAMLADVPHTRPISVFATSENPLVRSELDIERSSYEGPVGILSVIADAAENAGIPAISIWASVPHYVHNAPSPKATLALIDKIEELIDVQIDRGELVEESSAWESGIDALAGEDEDMAAYIQQLEQARDTVDSPEASGEAIAQEFERYLRKRGDGRAGGDGRPDEPWRRD